MDRTLKKYGVNFKIYTIVLIGVICFLLMSYLIFLGVQGQIKEQLKNLVYVLESMFMLGGLSCMFVFDRLVPQNIYFLDDNYLEIINKKTSQKVIYNFSEINDTFLFTSGKSVEKNNLIFRLNAHTPWYHVSPYTNKSERFFEEFLANYLKYKTEDILSKIEKGEKIEFKYIEKKSKIRVKFLINANRVYSKVATKSIYLDSDYVYYGSEKYFLKGMDPLSSNQLDILEFKNSFGKPHFKIHKDTFFNLEVLLTVYDKLIQKHKTKLPID